MEEIFLILIGIAWGIGTPIGTWPVFRTVNVWVVAVASSYEAAKTAAAALKVDWDKGPYASVSDQTIIDESRRLQKEGTEGFLFVKDGGHWRIAAMAWDLEREERSVAGA